MAYCEPYQHTHYVLLYYCRTTRQNRKFHVFLSRNSITSNIVRKTGVTLYNYFYDVIDLCCSYNVYKKNLKYHILNNDVLSVFWVAICGYLYQAYYLKYLSLLCKSYIMQHFTRPYPRMSTVLIHGILSISFSSNKIQCFKSFFFSSIHSICL